MPEAPTFWLYVDHRTAGNGHCPLIWERALMEGTLEGSAPQSWAGLGASARRFALRLRQALGRGVAAPGRACSQRLGGKKAFPRC